MRKKYIHQVLPNFSQRDAVGTDTLMIRDHLRSLGFESEIFYEETGSGDPRYSKPLSQLHPHFNRDDTAIILHFSIGSAFPGLFINLRNLKIVRYHNITPPEFFCAPAEGHIRNVCALGRQQIPMLATFSDYVIADSQYNLNEFLAYSQIEGSVVPIFRNYQELLSFPDSPELVESFRRKERKVLLFVGRICPNKAQHDLLKLVYLYKMVFSESITLVLVGGFFSQEFKLEIENYAAYLGLSVGSDLQCVSNFDVVIPGSISDQEVATLFRKADLYCSLSEHEGFGVPLVEAMYFQLPIMAHAEAAVPETLGQAGVLVDKGDWRQTLLKLKTALNDENFRTGLVEAGQKRAKELSLKVAKERLTYALARWT